MSPVRGVVEELGRFNGDVSSSVGKVVKRWEVDVHGSDVAEDGAVVPF